MLADVESCLDFLVGHSPFVFCKCKKKSSVILLENILGTLAFWIIAWIPGPLIFEEWRQYFRKPITSCQVLLMKLLCKKQLIIYINNIKIIIIS